MTRPSGMDEPACRQFAATMMAMLKVGEIKQQSKHGDHNRWFDRNSDPPEYRSSRRSNYTTFQECFERRPESVLDQQEKPGEVGSSHESDLVKLP